MKNLYITGVDTGVGKTIVAGGLAALLRQRGVDVGVMKPAESGARMVKGKLTPSDALYLKKMGKSPDPLETICPYRFEQSLSPYHAAIATGITIDIEKIMALYETLKAAHEVVIVEGAGGLLAPLTEKVSMGDLAKKMRAKVLIVSHPFLGNINHTLLTLKAVRSMRLSLSGIIYNQHKRKNNLATDFEFIEKNSGAKIFGMIRFIEKISNARLLAKSMEKLVDVDSLIKGLR